MSKKNKRAYEILPEDEKNMEVISENNEEILCSKESTQKIIATQLVVKSPFKNYKKGDLIFDQIEINSILNSHEQYMVCPLKV